MMEHQKQAKESVKKWRILSIGLIIVMLLAVGCQAAIPVPTSVEEVPRIDPDELQAQLAAGKDVIIVDARTREEFEGGHIAGAVSMPLDEVAQRYGELPKAGKIVFY